MLEKNNEQERGMIHEAFAKGIARLCAKHVWNQLGDIATRKKTSRTIHGKQREVVGVTQQQVAAQVKRDPGRVSRWIKDGTLNWIHLAFLMTDLDIEFDHFVKPLPTREERAAHGRREAMLKIRIQGNTGSRISPLRDDQFECLRLLVQSLEWEKATLISHEDLRLKQVDMVAESIASILDKKLGYRTEIRTAKEMAELEQEWLSAWDECEKFVKIKWNVS